ncbi:MAG: DUF58 domain-containing protein [Planctomycetota bacterium]|nr:MAG: DUF58 domain-containing protein [Planctomycetota bacterium]
MDGSRGGSAVTVRPGVNLVRAAAGLFAISILGLWLPTAALVGGIVIALGSAVCCFIDFRRLRVQFDGVSVDRRLPQVAGRDLAFPVEWTLRSRGDAAVRGSLRDESPATGDPRLALHRFELSESRPQAILEQTYRIPVRGRHTFGPVWIRIEGPLRFLEGQRAFERPGAIRVLPEQYASRDELIKDTGAEIALLDKIVYSRQHGAGNEFESLDEYRQGDDPRRIDWRTTARYGRPIIRRYQIERHRDVMIVIDCGRLMGTDSDRGSKLDCAVDSALLLGRVALQSGDRCGLGMFDDRVRGYLPPIAGPAAMNALADCVYDARVAWRESDFTPMFATLQRRQAKRSLLVILSDVVDAETSELFRTSLLQLQRRHVVLFAALRTPQLGRIIEEPIGSMLDGAHKAVTFRLLREREQALHSLHRGGIYVVDVEPKQLTAPLVNQFIELRQRNLL